MRPNSARPSKSTRSRSVSLLPPPLRVHFLCTAPSALRGALAESRAGAAYGSTYFHSWLRVAVEPVVSQALHSAADTAASVGNDDVAVQALASRGLVVLGSSIGWFSFFAHLLYGVPSMGYDLLCTEVEEAAAVAAKHQVDSSIARGVQFVCDDARNAELQYASVIWINGAVSPTAISLSPRTPPCPATARRRWSPGQTVAVISPPGGAAQVWSPSTRSGIYAKIAAEVAVGTLVKHLQQQKPWHVCWNFLLPALSRAFVLMFTGLCYSGDRLPRRACDRRAELAVRAGQGDGGPDLLVQHYPRVRDATDVVIGCDDTTWL